MQHMHMRMSLIRDWKRCLDWSNFAIQSTDVKAASFCSALLGVFLVSLGANAAVPELAEYRGHVVWLDFWASWCGPCRQSFPWMQSMQQRYASQGLIVVAVNLDHQQRDADHFLAGFAHDFTVRFDSAAALASSMNVKTMPTSFLLDSSGNIVASHVGFKQRDEKRYEQEMEQLLMQSLQR
jgi:cytochrome c biogenesis protein CcmG/thiol:disulfide interchange protein DsbE